jgi:thiamine transporter
MAVSFQDDLTPPKYFRGGFFMSNSKTAIMSEGALCVALSLALSMLAVFRMPQGGAITLDLVPLAIFAWRRGVGWGCGIGALTGVFNMIFGGYVVHPLQVLLDYPLAKAAIGLSGLWAKNQKPAGLVAGLVLGGLAQFTCHLLAGVFFFSSYAPEAMNPWLYSVIYNGTFLAPKLVLSIIVAWALWKRLLKIYPK